MSPTVIDTDHTLSDPFAAGRAIIDEARQNCSDNGLAVIASSRAIRSADNAATGLGADQATARRQTLPGAFVWDLSTKHGARTYVVASGNAG